MTTISCIAAVSSRPDGVHIGFLDDTVILCRADIESRDPLTLMRFDHLPSYLQGNIHSHVVL